MNGTTARPVAPGAGTAPAESDTLAPQADPLRDALLDSRQRWRTLVGMTADFVFETDAENRFVFISPDTVLGWPAAALLGQPAAMLLPEDSAGFDPFTPAGATRSRRAWLKRADGGLACLSFACTPVLAGGTVTGCRGVAQDVSVQDLREAQTAAALRRGEAIEHILWQMRQEILAPRMMQVALAELIAALGTEGAAVVTLIPAPDPLTVLHQAGTGLAVVLETLRPALEGEATVPVAAVSAIGYKVLSCCSDTRFGERAGLSVWRRPGERDWDEDDRLLVTAAAALIRVVLEHEAIQRELARQARTDPLTGLLNRRSFLEEMARRVDRLDHEGQMGTLLYMDLDHFKRLNDTCGHEVGDEALILAADMLRATVRPTDLVARLGGDEFATWMDGSDSLTAAERAERLRMEAPDAFARALPPAAMAAALSISIGIATCARQRGGYRQHHAPGRHGNVSGQARRTRPLARQPRRGLSVSITHAAAPGISDAADTSLDETARVKLAASQATAPETLSLLARDPSVTVRAAVALNTATPGAADQDLADDDDARVRLLLTRKLLTLLPDLSRADQARLRDQTLHVLSLLVQDAAVRVRTMIAEVLAEMPDAPHALIQTLAQDAAIPVSTPVLRLSPLLSDADLLSLLHGPPHTAAATVIAYRANLSAAVADAIAASGDAQAIHALLANPSAAIRETTLDALIVRAAGHPEWHEPLVGRPALPDHAARALAEIVASHLLETLASRTDLQAETIAALRARLAPRLAQASTEPAGDAALLDTARQMEARGTLDEATLLDASTRGDIRQMAALLAVAAGVTVATVDRAAAMRSPKALVSLVWKAGFSMRVAHAVQTVLGHVAPGSVLHAAPDAGFPLSVEEMAWQIEFLTTHSR